MPGSRAVVVLLASLAIAGGSERAARADGMVIVGGSPRAIGRAGADEIADDGGGALFVNPAALARRDVARAQVGVAFIDDNVSWTPDDPQAPVARGQIGSLALPLVAIELPVGEWILAAAAATTAVSNRSLTRPQVPPTAFGDQFQSRYTGLGGGVRRDTVTIGASHRLGDEIAVGLALGGSRVLVAETRDLWAGFSGIHPPGDPRDDITLAVTGEDRFAPSVVAGMMLVPNDTSLELAISVGWEQAANLDGTVSAQDTAGGPHAALLAPRAHLDLAQPWTIRAGARYAGERWIAELDGDLWVFPSLSKYETWSLSGVRVQSSGIEAAVDTLPSRLAPQTHGAVRGGLDVALMPGFLWATAGYAYTTRGTPIARLSPTFADLGGHTAALGLEANAGGFTITVGVSRTWAGTVRPVSSDYQLDNPFHAGDQSVPVGSYTATVDQVGVILDAELGSAK